MKADRAQAIIALLEKAFPIEVKEFASSWVAARGEGPFSVLVVTILTQNTNDVNALRAYKRLQEKVGISPTSIAEASIRELQDAIRPAGLFRNKSKSLKMLSNALLEKGRNFLEELLQKPYEEARARLMELPQVGPKTADVFLAILASAQVLPVDTHVSRVSRRLGLAPEKGDYEEIKAALENSVPAHLRHRAHMLLITLGRRVCKARRPLCPICPVEKLCPYPYKTEQL